MVDFRRWITVLAVLALCAGFASAQVGTPGGSTSAPLTCTTGSGAVTPQVRGEGYTELSGDIVINCVGGPNNAVPGSQILQANIVVSLNTAVTSRLLGSNGLSEALLMIDEPGSGVAGIAPGFGPTAPQTLCPTPLSGCVEYAVQTGVANFLGMSNTSSVAASGNTAGYNLFQGVVSGNQVTFFGVPVLPPATTGISRIFRVTNVRANATTLVGGSVIASVSTNGSTSLPISNPTLTVGFVQNSLSVSAGTTALTFQQCVSQALTSQALASTAQVGTLTYKELFGTAFKTRVAPMSATQYAGQGQNITAGSFQNTPGLITDSESGFIFQPLSNSGFYAGLADYGTRLKAYFSNIPAGVQLYVSVYSQNTSNVTPATAGSNIAITGPFAALVTSETASDGNGGAGFVPIVTGAYTFGAIPVSAVQQISGAGSAVWEVLNANPNTNETLTFGVYLSYTASPATGSPAAPATALVNMTYAPIPTQGAFTSTAAAAASSVLPIPRFADTSTALTLLKTSICQTALLWPFVSNQVGFDSGLAIANTSSDPFGTGAQSGTCTLNLYGAFATGFTPVTTFTTPVVASGTTYANNLGTFAPGFQGYVIGVCNFQYAHGYGAISDLAVRNYLASYLALVMNTGGLNRVASAGETLEN